MFDQFKSLGAVAGILRNREKIREAGEELKRRLEDIRAEGEAGGGAVRVTASGDMRILNVELSPAAMKSSDAVSRRHLESLIAEASTDALRRAKALLQGEIVRLTDELGLQNIPGLERLLPME